MNVCVDLEDLVLVCPGSAHVDLGALVRVKLIHWNPCSCYRGHGFIMYTCMHEGHKSVFRLICTVIYMCAWRGKMLVRVCLHACVCVRWSGAVCGGYIFSRLKDTGPTLQPHAHQAVMTAPLNAHTHTAMTAIMESVDRRLINCSSIETNDGTHWRDIVIVYCLNAWSLCIMHMSMCVWRCQKREAVLFLSPPPPPAMPRVNHYGLTHFYTFDLKKKCVCESKRKHVKPCNCI